MYSRLSQRRHEPSPGHFEGDDPIAAEGMVVFSPTAHGGAVQDSAPPAMATRTLAVRPAGLTDLGEGTEPLQGLHTSEAPHFSASQKKGTRSENVIKKRIGAETPQILARRFKLIEVLKVEDSHFGCNI